MVSFAFAKSRQLALPLSLVVKRHGYTFGISSSRISRISIRAALLAGAIILAGCDDVPGGNTRVAAECAQDKNICIRVENSSELNFQTFQVNFDGQTISFGPLTAGAISRYRMVDAAYRYAFTEAFSDERRFVLQPIDFVGEQYLEPGAYTYRYTVTIFDEPVVRGDWKAHGNLDVRLIADDNGSE